jgi:hypothetical protein
MWSFIQIREIEEFEKVAAEGDRLDAAGLTAMAFHEPQRLQDADTKWRERAKLVLVISAKEAIERGKRMAARILKAKEIEPTIYKESMEKHV